MSAFNMDDILVSLNTSMDGGVVKNEDIPNHKLFSFTENGGTEYELTTGKHKGMDVVKVRYNSNLTPLNKDINGYYIIVFSGKNIDDTPKFKTIRGIVNPASNTLVRFTPKIKTKSKDVKMKATGISGKLTKNSIKKDNKDIKMPTQGSRSSSRISDLLSKQGIELPYESDEQERKQRIKEIKEEKVKDKQDVDDLAGMMGNLFGKKRKTRKNNNLATVNADIKYLKLK